ncbi:MAG: ATP-dependent zinc metalloprotease FtsH [Clostridia bacterium]|nr:ATP-dependent zinc metalloprotease FtsH [Clostridia bacterium]
MFKSKASKTISVIITILLCIVLVVVLVELFTQRPVEISYDRFVEIVENNGADNENGAIAAVYIEGNYRMNILFKDSKSKSISNNPDAYVYIPNRTTPIEMIYELEAKGATVPTIILNDPSKNSIWSSLLPIVIGIVLIGVFLFILNRQNMGANNKAMSFGATKARVTGNVKERFSDVAGAEEEKEELKEIVEFLRAPQKFTDVGAKIPKGVLLVGPPGTGKTLFAKAVAGEAGVPFFSISGSDFVEMFVGVGASRVRDLFIQAKKNMPCIVFIDEIDAVGRQRGAGLGGGHDEREQTLNQLLVQMDGFEANDGVIVMAATNRADILDPALLRPGRFDRQIYVNAPDVKGREEILRVHSRNKPLSGDIDFKTVARLTIGFTGADIANLLNEAAILAARANRRVIIMQDILEGINKVIMGPQKKSRVVTETDKRITAYHESGHAIVAKVLENCDEVQEVSIIPRGMAAGYTLTRPETDDSHVTKNKLLDTICMMLGGRAAESIVIKDISTGASNDIQRASSIARSMVTEWGMSDVIGNLYLGSDHEVFIGKTYGQHSDVSESMSGIVDTEIKKIMDEAYKRAFEILEKHRDVMEKMVTLLYEKETIFKEEVDALFEGASVEDILKKDRVAEELRAARKNGVVIVPEKNESETASVEKETEAPAPSEEKKEEPPKED